VAIRPQPFVDLIGDFLAEQFVQRRQAPYSTVPVQLFFGPVANAQAVLDFVVAGGLAATISTNSYALHLTSQPGRDSRLPRNHGARRRFTIRARKFHFGWSEVSSAGDHATSAKTRWSTSIVPSG